MRNGGRRKASEREDRRLAQAPLHLGGDGGLAGALGEGLFDGAPGEHGAFDALREFADAGKKLEVAEFGRLRGRVSGRRRVGAGNQLLEGVTKGGGFSPCFAFQFHCHHRGGGLADSAALAAEFDLG